MNELNQFSEAVQSVQPVKFTDYQERLADEALRNLALLSASCLVSGEGFDPEYLDGMVAKLEAFARARVS